MTWESVLFFRLLKATPKSFVYPQMVYSGCWDARSSLEEFFGAGSGPLHKALDALGLGGRRQQSLGSEDFGFLLAISRNGLAGCLQVRTCTRIRSLAMGANHKNSKWSTITKACAYNLRMIHITTIDSQLRTVPSRASKTADFIPWIQDFFDCWLRIFADHGGTPNPNHYTDQLGVSINGGTQE